MALVLGVAVTVCAVTVGPWCAISPDGIAYLEAARSLWTAGAFPAERMIRPPGYSILIAPLLGDSDLPELSLRWLAAACWIGSSMLAMRLARGQLGRFASVAIGIGVATHGLLLTQTTFVLTELPFMPLMLSALLVAANWERSDKPTRIGAVVAGLLAGAAGMVRSMGIVLGPAIVASVLLNKGIGVRRKAATVAVFSLAFALPHVAWSLRQARYDSSYGYGTIWTQPRPIENTDATGLALQWQRFRQYGPLRLAEIRTALIGDKVAWRLQQGRWAALSGWIIGGAVVALILGFVIARRSAVDFFVATALGVLALWPWDEGPRFVAPLVPLLLIYVASAGHEAWKRRELVRGGRWLIAAGVAGFALIHLAEFVTTVSRLPVQADKAQRRVADMRALADRLEREAADHRSVTAVTFPDDNAKTIIAGGAYFARHRLEAFIETNRPHSIDLWGASGLIVIQTPLASAINAGGLRQIGKIGNLILAERRPDISR